MALKQTIIQKHEDNKKAQEELTLIENKNLSEQNKLNKLLEEKKEAEFTIEKLKSNIAELEKLEKEKRDLYRNFSDLVKKKGVEHAKLIQKFTNERNAIQTEVEYLERKKKEMQKEVIGYNTKLHDLEKERLNKKYNIEKEVESLKQEEVAYKEVIEKNNRIIKENSEYILLQDKNIKERNVSVSELDKKIKKRENIIEALDLQLKGKDQLKVEYEKAQKELEKSRLEKDNVIKTISDERVKLEQQRNEINESIRINSLLEDSLEKKLKRVLSEKDKQIINKYLKDNNVI